jgi:cephalosporin hydroxylase
MGTRMSKTREYHKKLDKRMFDFEEFYSRVADELPDNSVIAEVGVADGSSAIFLAEALLNLEKKFKFYLVDNMAYGGNDQLRTIVNHAIAARVGEYMEIMPYDSLNASCRFPDRHFDFVFIDASHHYEFTKADIRLWHRKVKDSGTLAGHDYNNEPNNEVKQAVDEVVPEKDLHLEETSKGYGLWFIRSQIYVRLN